jgi:hypothetical protein
LNFTHDRWGLLKNQWPEFVHSQDLAVFGIEAPIKKIWVFKKNWVFSGKKSHGKILKSKGGYFGEKKNRAKTG